MSEHKDPVYVGGGESDVKGAAAVCAADMIRGRGERGREWWRQDEEFLDYEQTWQNVF